MKAGGSPTFLQLLISFIHEFSVGYKLKHINSTQNSSGMKMLNFTYRDVLLDLFSTGSFLTRNGV